MSSKDKISTLIIGAGKISAFYDKPDQKSILTHCHAFTTSGKFKVVGIYDIDENKSKVASEIWNIKQYKNFDDAFQNKIDVIVIATPDDSHFNYLKLFASKKIKLIFCEKPIVTKFEEIEEIKKIYQNNKITLLVNYSRRYINEIQQLKRKIKSNEFGKVICGTGYYGKGLIHNGSHMIDLINYLFDGKNQAFNIHNKINDFYPDDNTISFSMKVNNAIIDINGTPQGLFTIFELDLLFEKKRVQLTDGCSRITEYDIKEDKQYKGHKGFHKESEYSVDMTTALVNAVEHIYDIINVRQQPICSLKDCDETMRLCFQIKEREQNE